MKSCMGLLLCMMDFLVCCLLDDDTSSQDLLNLSVHHLFPFLDSPDVLRKQVLRVCEDVRCGEMLFSHKFFCRYICHRRW